MHITEEEVWTVARSADLYNVDRWSAGFFGLSSSGRVLVLGENGNPSIEIKSVIDRLREQGVRLPVLIRFQDIIAGRVRQLNEAFQAAIDEFGYENVYRGVYPIKVNQLHEVVDEILDAGKAYNMGIEVGSKTELVAGLAHLEDDETLLLSNGYKDDAMIDMLLSARKLGKNVVPIVEKYEEFERILARAERIAVRPRFGVRIRIKQSGSGRWAESGGDRSKFGISIPRLLDMLKELEQRGLTDSLVLLHFHLGSQISDIQALKQAVREMCQIYAALRLRGVPIEFIDVGGGLGVDYDGTLGASVDGINYSMQEYANAIVEAARAHCDREGVPHPVIVSESGRALTAHHSVLVVEVLGANRKDFFDEGSIGDKAPGESAHEVIRDMYGIHEWMRDTASPKPSQLLEALHDAVAKRNEVEALFGFGYLTLEDRAIGERLYWTICRSINMHIERNRPDWLPEELDQLDDHLADLYMCDFSVFQSALDHWAIGQRFPIVPLSRLDEEPNQRAVLVDLTCDSDGKVKSYVTSEEDESYLMLHNLRRDEPYHLGFFLMGAYQDIMGDAHNLFGRPNEVHVYADPDEPEGFYIEKLIPATSVGQMLEFVQYFAEDLRRRMEKIVRSKVRDGVIRKREGVDLLESYSRFFSTSTYLEDTLGS